ncbi:hypothetical protein TNCV_2282651 [Trichonephila clavipes]|nr:hypothetical protein TNCV_2282651 [Trichonephila clavipes]
MGNSGHCGPNPEAPVARFRLTTEMTFWEYISTGLAWLLTMPAHSEAMQKWIATTCPNALDLLNTRLMTSSVGTARLGVKRSKSQVREFDK